MSSTAIDVRGLTLGYSGRIVMQDVNFTVEAGEVFIILGGSGCGKSTLLKHMIGLYPPMQGEVFILGHDIVTAQGQARRGILRQIGVTYQSGALFGSMSLMENICLPLEEFTALPREAREAVARMKLKQVGLTGSEEKLPSELSGGMQKRAAIARAMALDPAILFLDEPQAGLDPITSAGLDDLILTLSQSLGITFVIVSHELASIFAIADRALMLDAQTKGVIALGPPEELKESSENPKVRQFFNREAQETDT